MPAAPHGLFHDDDDDDDDDDMMMMTIIMMMMMMIMMMMMTCSSATISSWPLPPLVFFRGDLLEIEIYTERLKKR